jgi:hypothetical protein
MFQLTIQKGQLFTGRVAQHHPGRYMTHLAGMTWASAGTPDEYRPGGQD